MRARFAIRCYNLVLIDSETGGDNREPDWFAEVRGYTPYDSPGEPFNLHEDLGERVNLYAEKLAVVDKLSLLLAEARKVYAPADNLLTNNAHLSE